MDFYVLSHFSDAEVLRLSKTRRTGERGAIAQTLAAICEVEARKLYVPAGYPSLFAYLTDELGYSEDEAGRRIHASRTAREYGDLIFPALADGRLHLTAVILLAPRLTPANAQDLLAAAAGRSKSQIEMLIAERFPKADVPTAIRTLPGAHSGNSHAPERVEVPVPELVPSGNGEHAPERVDPVALHPAQHAPERVAPSRPSVKPLAPQRYALQLTMRQEMHDKLRHAQALLRRELPTGDAAEVLERALDALIARLEKRKFAATDKPRAAKGSKSPRQIPAAVKREVWKRDGGQCTYVSELGHRCPERGGRLEYDHATPVARGGQSTDANLRLRCRAHNQYAAERAFGAEFMQSKREQALRASAVKRSASNNLEPGRAGAA